MDEFIQAVGFRNLSSERANQVGTLAKATILNNVLSEVLGKIDATQHSAVIEAFEHGEPSQVAELLATLGFDFETLIDNQTDQYVALMIEAGKHLRGEDE